MEEFARVVRRRRKGSIVLACGLATLLLGNLGWSYHSSQRDAAAQARLSQIVASFNSAAGERSNREPFERIIADAQKIKRDYGSSRVAQLAQYYIAVSEENLGNTERAVQHLQELIDHGDPMMRSLGQFALGTLYRNHGDSERAMAIFRQLEESGAYSNHASQLGHHPARKDPSSAGPSF